MTGRFSPVQLARLRLAESVAPWGPVAENLRMEYLAVTLQAVNTTDHTIAHLLADRRSQIANLLWGTPDGLDQ